jgi:beta-lactamase class A
MVATKTGNDRLRAGLPESWRVGDKTGTGERGTANDIAVIWPTGRAPMVMTVYLTGASGTAATKNAVIADVARAVVTTLG